MANHRSLQSKNTHCRTFPILAPSSICSFVLIILLTSYISLGKAAPTALPKEKQLTSEKKNVPAETQSDTKWVKGRLLITPRAGLPMQEMEKALKPYGAKSKHHLKQLNVHILELPTEVDEVKAMRALKNDKRFKHVELDMMVAPEQLITDPAFNNSWNLTKIQAPDAWNTANGDSIIVAILDTGVNDAHPDLAANMVPGWNTFNDNADTADVHGHGTKVAGTVAAAANNGMGSAGVSWGSSIMPIRISDSSGLGYFSTIAEGIRWAADHGAKVVNNSYSSANSSTVQSAAAYLRSKGGVVIVSAGNTGGFVDYPANDSLLVAAATDKNDLRASFSSYGAYVDIAAPGVSIYTTTRDGNYGNVSGTSFSSPIVAATAALMFSANHDLTPADVDRILKSTSIDLGTQGFDQFYGAGRVNAAAAVAAASKLINVDDQAPNISIAAPTGGEVSGVIPVDVNYDDNVGVVRIELLVDGQKIITDTQSPFAFAWNTTTLANGNHILTAQAFDSAGNMGTSPNVLVTVNNAAIDSEAPSIAITAPTGGEVSGIVPVNVNTADNVAVVRVELFVNGQKTITDSQAPFSFNWNTTTLADGNYSLTTKAFDAGNNAGTSPAVTVTVNNTPLSVDTAAPVITSFNLTDGMHVARRQPVNVSATDDQAVAQISLIINGKEVAVSRSDALSYSWNTRTKRNSNTSHTVTVKISDQAGNITSKTVTVYN